MFPLLSEEADLSLCLFFAHVRFWRAREIVLKTKLRWYRRRGSVGAVVVVKVQLLPYDKP